MRFCVQIFFWKNKDFFFFLFLREPKRTRVLTSFFIHLFFFSIFQDVILPHIGGVLFYFYLFFFLSPPFFGCDLPAHRKCYGCDASCFLFICFFSFFFFFRCDLPAYGECYGCDASCFLFICFFFLFFQV